MTNDDPDLSELSRVMSEVPDWKKAYPYSSSGSNISYDQIQAHDLDHIDPDWTYTWNTHRLNEEDWW